MAFPSPYRIICLVAKFGDFKAPDVEGRSSLLLSDRPDVLANKLQDFQVLDWRNEMKNSIFQNFEDFLEGFMKGPAAQ